MRKKSKELKRIENTKFPKGNIYIFCEGEKTERNYFSSFKSKICRARFSRRKPPQIKVIPSKNCGAPSNVEFVIGYAKSQSLSEKDGDCLICVIDCDSNQEKDINKAIKMAKGKEKSQGVKVNICLSNPSFELWYLLHYECCYEKLDQKTLEQKLRKHIKDYKKNVDYYSFLEDKKSYATSNAQYLKEYHSNNDIELLSTKSNPSTMIPFFLEHITNFIENT
ncbi:RloB family protein [Methanosarcina mazei]|jgi:hypothetical protein|uniref:RloB domain-containing protein n=2 Tax=Methanosarcina mazei TaxID=2209 RepID=A0A0F8HMW8_METMZ|nr:RloB family protein [Methanosarcina mazei]AKB71446.1 hypothetical protein MSMAC_1556 [Methanosarcina mazei C16]KKG17371.1 hypothetical protein DU34_14200 [Methanosarcina mazei]KKG28184.1 hypothetical protein DU49_06895 [Methanosarcina mazei]KKG40713.1 hypothetical protein DU39_12345 [Methanosarcina mazei]KKG41183.1 hypothetical protein DU41_13425 [Methanosarcina mazei]